MTTVGDLRRALEGLADSLPVRVEVTFDDGDGFEGADLQGISVEERCDEVEALYLWGDQDLPSKHKTLLRSVPR